MSVTPAMRRQLNKDMRFVFDHFGLSPEARKTAKAAALYRTITAATCYRAIAWSLGIPADRQETGGDPTQQEK